MPQENNQNFNQSMPQQPQKSGSGLNTILLIILIALVGFGIWTISAKLGENNRDTQVSIQETQPDQNLNEIDNQAQQELPNQYSKKTAYGVTVDVPKELGFQSMFGDYGVSVGTKFVTISNPVNNHIVVNFTKYQNSASFNENTAGFNSSCCTLVMDDYSIGNTVGSLYNSKDGSLESSIVIPSKLLTVTISAPTFAGVDQIVIDKILKSVEFE